MSYSIPLFQLNYTEAEEHAVVDVLRSKWISMGPKTEELETSFARYVGADHAVAVSSCTAALHLALAALGVGEGDEVIVPSMTFVATVNAVRYVGGTPVFADITGPEHLGIDPEHVKTLIGARTKAILPMHYAGFACHIESLATLAREHGLYLVEDAAHAPASFYQGRHLGTFGDVGCFSFFSNKNVACGEGGMLVTDSEEIARRVRLMRSHGMTTLSYDRSRGHATKYDVVVHGYNYRLDDIRAAITLVQMQKLEAETRRRAQLRQRYVDDLRTVEGVVIPYRDYSEPASHYIFPVLLEDGPAKRRDAIRNELAKRGVQTSVHYPAVHRFTTYAGQQAGLPKTEHATDHQLTLPMFGALQEREVDYVAEALATSVRLNPA